MKKFAGGIALAFVIVSQLDIAPHASKTGQRDSFSARRRRGWWSGSFWRGACWRKRPPWSGPGPINFADCQRAALF